VSAGVNGSSPGALLHLLWVWACLLPRVSKRVRRSPGAMHAARHAYRQQHPHTAGRVCTSTGVCPQESLCKEAPWAEGWVCAGPIYETEVLYRLLHADVMRPAWCMYTPRTCACRAVFEGFTRQEKKAGTWQEGECCMDLKAEQMTAA
jgi:hypothetical protein